TPPVALAAFAASSIAKEPGLKIGLKAVQIAIAGFVVPYMAVYDPAIMLQGNPSVLAVAYVLLKAVLAIALWGGAAIGYFWAPLNVLERVLATAAAASLIVALPATDELGFALTAAFVAVHWLRKRRQPCRSA
ncbi:MAG: TRAP transporter permease, partial [Candidatus Accumulibacter sp.]|nr:TRAP transporter permease [Accumulibacter sp.]